MRFLADMGVAGRIVDWLRTQGHEATHLRDEGLGRLADAAIFEKAVSEKRTILTFDLDFSQIAAVSRGTGVSVIVFRLKNARTPHVIERLAAVLPDCEEALRSGAVVAVEESRHRIRPLPIGQTGS
jgi:predicted nuclease of predicted toxin-antitoxin system